MKRYLLRIELNDVNPKIWRRFIVPAHISLDRLHDVIQIIMGWSDCHLYEFEIGKKCYTLSPEEGDTSLDAARYALDELVKKKGLTFSYRYDFGDSWDHTLTLEQVLKENEPVAELGEESMINQFSIPLSCIEGGRACPPEDVGGVPGYENFCQIISDPKHSDHAETLAWYESMRFPGEGFDPEAFELDLVNAELFKYLRWSRDRELPFLSL